jgi:anti-sigma regulatory factor (Ser/Thr protein kinase)/anti-anti-sigma regulatory factor
MSVRANETITLLVPSDTDRETVEGFYAELDSRLSESPAEVLLDCSLLEHASSTHINTLWQARNRCEEAGIAIKLTSVTYGLERVLVVLDLYDLFVAERDGVEAGAGARGPDMSAAPPAVLALKVDPTADGIKRAMQALHGYLMELDVGEMFAFDLETVFYEVTTNISLHGKLDASEPILVTAAPRNGVLRLRFEDPGPRFDPTRCVMDFDPKKAGRNRQRHGFGLAMIMKLVDRVSYERRDDHLNVLNLEKKIGRNGGRFS